MNSRIMVLDDDRQIRQSLLKLLQTEGYEVVLAADGQQGLERFDPTKIDLLLLDLNLPGKSGWDIFEHVTFINPMLPIIVITGKEQQYEVAVAAGVSALMEKPLDVPLLLSTIRDLLTEPAEKRLKRLVGQEDSFRYFRAPPASSNRRPQVHRGPALGAKPQQQQTKDL